jgi:hypothetical protein
MSQFICTTYIMKLSQVSGCNKFIAFQLQRAAIKCAIGRQRRLHAIQLLAHGKCILVHCLCTVIFALILPLPGAMNVNKTGALAMEI